MKYYSNKTFFIILIINILAALITFLILFLQFLWDGLSEELMFSNTNFIVNLFVFIIPLPSIIFSTFIVLLQQRGYRRLGYFMVVLAGISSYYLVYPQIGWNFWSDIGYFVSTQPALFNFAELILILASLVPFYVLGRLIKEDFFKKIK